MLYNLDINYPYSEVVGQLKKRLEEKSKTFFLIDTREQEEFDEGKIPGAILIPWYSIEDHITGIKKDKEIILYCRTGVRAARATEVLEKLGYHNVILYKEGWEQWQEKGIN